jgi:hypothetical protein
MAPDAPASAFDHVPPDPRVRGPTGGKCRPCGFSPCEYDAVKLDMRTIRLLDRACMCRVDAAAKRAGETDCQRSSTQGSVGATGAIALANDPAHQAPPLRSFAARGRSCIVASLGAMFRYRLEPSRPGTAGGPSLCPPCGAHGVSNRPSQACSRDGWPVISDPLAHVPVRPMARPD